MRDDPHVSDLLPGYSLGCLEPEEAERVRAHVAGCAACAGELAGLDEVTGSLALALPGAQPRGAVEDALMQRVLASAPAAARADSPARAPAAGPARRAASRNADFLRSPAWGIAAMVLVLILAAGNVAQLVRPGASARTADVEAPGLTTVALTGVNSGKGAYGTVVLDMEDNGGVLAVRGLPLLDEAHQYQLWLIRGTERRSGGVFSVDREGYGNLLLSIPKDFRGFTAIGISIEPAGGSPAPTGARVAAGTI